MNVLPPWKLAEREEWAEARPWLAGLYFGLLMSLFSAVYLMIIGGTEQLYLAAVGGLVSWPKGHTQTTDPHLEQGIRTIGP